MIHYSYLLSYLNLNNMTNHILLPIINIDVDFLNLKILFLKLVVMNL